MKLSIVTINYENLIGLKATLNSVCDVKSFVDFEYVVVDGNSSDGSGDLLRSHISVIDVLIIEPDTGIYNAMNKGIFAASGSHILFLNSGERLLAPIKDLLNLSDEIVYAGVKTIYEKRSIRFAKSGFPIHQGLVMSRDMLSQYLFDERYRVHGDLDLWYRCNYLNIKKRILDFDIVEMVLEGIGTHPSGYRARMSDRLLLIANHNKLRDYISLLRSFSFYIVYLILGDTIHSRLIKLELAARGLTEGK